MMIQNRMPILLALLSLGALALLPCFAGIDVGQAAENFSLQPAEGGKAVSLLDFKGKPTLVVFWATWCPPCRREIPELKDIHKNYAAKGLQMVTVAINYRETREDVIRFKQVNELPYLVLWDEENKTYSTYSVEGIPTVILLDSSGVIKYRGHQINDDLMRLLDGLTKGQEKS